MHTWQIEHKDILYDDFSLKKSIRICSVVRRVEAKMLSTQKSVAQSSYSITQHQLPVRRGRRLQRQERRKRLQENLLARPVLLWQWKVHQGELSMWQRQWLRRWQWRKRVNKRKSSNLAFIVTSKFNDQNYLFQNDIDNMYKVCSGRNVGWNNQLIIPIWGGRAKGLGGARGKL